MKNYLSLFFFIIFLSAFFSCKYSKTKINFYYTKNNFSLTENQKKEFEVNKTEKIYLKFFSLVKIKNKPSPTNVIVGDNLPRNKKIIPVISVEKALFNELSLKSVDTLANRIAQFNNQIYEVKRIRPLEISFDYSWDLKSAKKYTYFLKKIAKLTNQEVSVFIRPNQLKQNQNKLVDFSNQGIFVISTIEDQKLTNELENLNIKKVLLSTNLFYKSKTNKIIAYLKANLSLDEIIIENN